jgi:NadR type nicotinamide-nucleotide adenylyltransferase
MRVADSSGPRYRHGLIIGKFYPLHAGHSFLIRHALRMCESVSVQVFGSSVESIPLEERTSWVREEHPTARVVSAMDDAPVDFDSDGAWRTHVSLIESLLTEPVDAVFTSDAYGEELARRLSAEWVCVDPQRMSAPVSGTAIRADLAGHWAELPASARASLTARVVVLGAESTGSTTLAEALAHELHTNWVPEYGREYSLIREGGPFAEWRSEEFDLVVDRQIAMEWTARRTAPVPVIVCDTDVLATALWHERYLGAPAPRILATSRSCRTAFVMASTSATTWRSVSAPRSARNPCPSLKCAGVSPNVSRWRSRPCAPCSYVTPPSRSHSRCALPPSSSPSTAPHPQKSLESPILASRLDR